MIGEAQLLGERGLHGRTCSHIFNKREGGAIVAEIVHLLRSAQYIIHHSFRLRQGKQVAVSAAAKEE